MSLQLHVVRQPGEPGPALLAREVRYLGPTGGALTELEPHSLRAHHAHYGIRPRCDGTARRHLLEELDRQALSGRGGGHFAVAAKWRAVRSAGRPPVLVANGAEGEPGSRKDRALLEFRPHLVLDGLACAADALGAADAVIWLHDDDHAVRASLARALAERQAHLDDVPMRVAIGPDHYLTGEASAAARGVAGGPAVPQFHRIPLALGGPDGRPTLVQNVETLARVALAARGVDAAQTVLASVVDGDSVVVVELSDRVPVTDVVRAALGEVEVSAVLVGGHGGNWLDAATAAGTSLCESELRARGCSLGAAVIEPLPPGRCGVARAADIASALAAAGTRQCGPCLFGLDAIADSMATLAAGGRRSRRESDRIEGFVAQVRGRGACHHPDGAARMVTSALDVFAADVAAHMAGRCLHRASRRCRRA